MSESPPLCPMCGGAMTPSFCAGGLRKTRGVVTPMGQFDSVRLAAEAHGIAMESGKSRIRHKSQGWAYSGQTHALTTRAIYPRKKFCSPSCRDAWHADIRDKERHARLERSEFALRLLCFMEKHYPAQVDKMRAGFSKRREG